MGSYGKNLLQIARQALAKVTNMIMPKVAQNFDYLVRTTENSSAKTTLVLNTDQEVQDLSTVLLFHEGSVRLKFIEVHPLRTAGDPSADTQGTLIPPL